MIALLYLVNRGLIATWLGYWIVFFFQRIVFSIFNVQFVLIVGLFLSFGIIFFNWRGLRYFFIDRANLLFFAHRLIDCLIDCVIIELI